MKNINKFLAFALAAVMLLSLAACSSAPAPAEKTALETFVEENNELLVSSFEEGFTSGGMDCACTISAEENTLLISCNITGVDAVSEEVAEVMATTLDLQKEILVSAFVSLVESSDIYIEDVVLEMCEEDGDVITTLNVPVE